MRNVESSGIIKHNSGFHPACDLLEQTQCALTLHGCVHLHVIDTDGSRNGTDEAYKLLVGVHSHPTMPLGQPARGPQGPETKR